MGMKMAMRRIIQIKPAAINWPSNIQMSVQLPDGNLIKMVKAELLTSMT